MQKWHLREVKRDGSAQTFVYETHEEHLRRLRRAADTHQKLRLALIILLFNAFCYWIYATWGASH